MIIFSKIATVLFLPPGIFFLALILLIIFVPRKYKYFLGIIALFLYLFSTQPLSDLLLRPLEDAYPLLPEKTEKNWPYAIVVLGGGTIQGSPESDKEQVSLSSDAMKRAIYAFTLKDKFPVPIIFTGGKVYKNDLEPEVDAARRLYEALGLSSLRFIAESESRNTWENAAGVAKIFAEEKIIYRNVILVTSAYHIKRGVYCFERHGIKIIPAPTDYKCDRGRKYDLFSFLPSMKYFQNTWIALHEYIGLLYYVIAYRYHSPV